MEEVTKAMRLAFGRCPKCNQKTIANGRWLRGCTDRTCGWYGPVNETRTL